MTHQCQHTQFTYSGEPIDPEAIKLLPNTVKIKTSGLKI